MTRTHTHSRKGLHKGNHHLIVCFLNIPARSPWAKPAPSARIFVYFLLCVLWCTDSYLNSPQNLHQIESENYVREQKESHNAFYLHDGTERKHLGFGTATIYSTLTSNPDRKNKPLSGKFDRRTLIFLYLLRSGDVPQNPGPNTTRQADVSLARDQPIPPQANVANATATTTTMDPQIPIKPSYIGTRGKEPLCPIEGHNAAEYQGPGTPAAPSRLTGELQVINAGVRSCPQIPAIPSYIGTQVKKPLCPTEGHNAAEYDSSGTPAVPSGVTAELQVINPSFRSHPQISVKPSDIGTRRKETLSPTEGHNVAGSGDPECPTAEHDKSLTCGCDSKLVKGQSQSLPIPPPDLAGDSLMNAGKAHFVIQHRAQLIQKVTAVMPIVDSLGQSMVHPEIYAGIQAETTSMKQMRILYTEVLTPGGRAIGEAFYDALKQHQPDLLKSFGPDLPVEDSTEIHAEVPPAGLQCKAIEPRQQLKDILKNQKNFRCVSEWTQAGERTRLNQIFTEVYITKGDRGEVNKQHEVRQIELASRKPPRQETPIKFNDIFKPLDGEGEIKTVMMKGVAGIGKTVLTQKYILDWAENQTNQDIDFMFLFTFRKLNLEKEENHSLVELLHPFFGETTKAVISSLNKYKVLFIFDGLDECRFSLSFKNTKIWTDVAMPTSVDVLLINLIRKNLLPSACIWITTRPAAAELIPRDYFDRVTEVRGFADPQKRQYFMKRFSDDENKARTIISHIEKSRSLKIMCHIPVFCWITANVLEDMLSKEENVVLPKTQCEMYIHFIVLNYIQKEAKYHDGTHGKFDSNPDKAIRSLGKLAYKQLQKGNLIFYETDLKECGIDLKDAAWYSGVFTQIFKEERGMYKDTVFCFVHLSVQEFLAALYVFLKYKDTGVNLLSTPVLWPALRGLFRDKSNLNDLHQTAVDNALQSPNGHLDLFLRFLLGLSLESNRVFLQRLLKHPGKRSQTSQKTVAYIKEKIRENPSAERTINLFHCLNELNDRSLEEEIQQYLSTGCLSTAKLSPAQWSAVVFVLLSSNKELDVFDLKKYQASDEALLGLLPLVQAANRALLSGCNLSVRCCEGLSSAISANSSSLRELDLSNNNLQDLGVQQLSVGLRSPYCLLEILRLSGCNLSERCCKVLSSVISANSSSLRELDLGNNDLQDLGIQQLSVGLGSPHCVLEILSLSGCLVSEKGCAYLVSALRSNSHLKVLDFDYNHPGDGVELLSALPLETLSVEHDGERRLQLGLKKYSCSLSLDVNTVHKDLSLSEEDRKVTTTHQLQGYPDHPQRFTYWPQVLSKESVREGGRSYWEVELRGVSVCIAVCYKDINRQGDESLFGDNSKSWCLRGSHGNYTFKHNKVVTAVSGRCSSRGVRVGVYLDHSAGTLSFYSVTDTMSMTLLHTVHTTFTQPLYAGIGVYFSGDTAELCRMW